MSQIGGQLLFMGIYGAMLAPFYIFFRFQDGIHTLADFMSNLTYLSWIANIGFMIEAFYFLRKRCPPISLTIVTLALASLSGQMFGFATFNDEFLFQAGGIGHIAWYTAMLIVTVTSVIESKERTEIYN